MATAVHDGAAEVPEAQTGLLQRMRTMEMNMEHHLEFIIEVLARLEVTQLPIGEGKLDKKTQRAWPWRWPKTRTRTPTLCGR
jgi:hypothetical protein